MAAKRKQHNYQRKIKDLVSTGKLPIIPGTVGILNVTHSNECEFWKGGACNCNPDLEIQYPNTGQQARKA